MDRNVQRGLAERLVSHFRAGTQDLAESELLLPTDRYRDPAWTAAEREMIRRLPVVAAHGSELPEPGDFVTDELLGTPVLLVRQSDGGVKGFVNVCRHRATQVEWERCGNRRLFSCPYHAWTYERNGELRNVPVGSTGFAGVDTADYGLIELPTEERHGMVWVVLTPGADIDVAAHLGAALDADLAAWDLSGVVQERVERFDNPFNWKYTIDGFLEGYHVRFLHARSIGRYFVSDVNIFDQWGPHCRTMPPRTSFGAVAEGPVEDIPLPEVTFPIYILFPATVLVWQHDHWELWTSLPDAVDATRSVTRVRLLVSTGAAAVQDQALWDKNWKILMDTIAAEDWRAAELAQRALTSAPPHLVFGRNEPALQHFHRAIEERCTSR